MITGRILLSAVLGLVVSTAQANVKPLIVGGVEAVKGEFPFMVSLQRNGSHFCGGSLIRKNWVLTAAHCVTATSVIQVVVGLHDRSDRTDAETFGTTRIIRHAQYSSRTLDYDFALIQLNGNSRFAPIELNPTEMDGVVANFTVAGWGTTREGSSSLPMKLQKVDVPNVTEAICNVAYNGEITPRMICAGFEAGLKDSCQGDSGGPMFETRNGVNVLVGTVSWGEGCARPKKYGVYGKVSSVTDWINTTIGN
jgi:trypsin